LLNERFALVDGHVLIPDGPGLGISVNDEVLTRYSS
jgi:L-alanine-DL-glutamate epimerase-like enolase superfamily enzyme